MDKKLNRLLVAVGENIVRLRKEKGMSQEDLAFKSKVNRTYMGYIENAKYNVTLGKLLNIASALETDIENLFKDVK